MFIAMLRQHISKEDNVLYMMAEQIDQSLNNGDELMLPKFNTVKLSEADKLLTDKLLELDLDHT